jgi:hypothetical protein
MWTLSQFSTIYPFGLPQNQCEGLFMCAAAPVTGTREIARTCDVKTVHASVRGGSASAGHLHVKVQSNRFRLTVWAVALLPGLPQCVDFPAYLRIYCLLVVIVPNRGRCELVQNIPS